MKKASRRNRVASSAVLGPVYGARVVVIVIFERHGSVVPFSNVCCTSFKVSLSLRISGGYCDGNPGAPPHASRNVPRGMVRDDQGREFTSRNFPPASGPVAEGAGHCLVSCVISESMRRVGHCDKTLWSPRCRCAPTSPDGGAALRQW